ncbi:30S ribosomal protein S6 [Clostridia bacterium]|nr:30S ribosomal protein S6 [Clostridia bacterium]
MAKITEKYETIIVATLRNGEEGAKVISDKFQKLIEDNATPETATIDVWGKRRLAYLIEDEQDGYYILYHFESKPDFPAELERIANITDGVLRSLTTLAQE